MTIAAGIPIYRYDGNDSATTFPFSQIFRADGDLEVIRTDTGGNEVTLVLDTDYTVTGEDTTSAGSVEFPISGSSYYPDPLATGYKLTIIRASDKARLTDMSEGFFFIDMNRGEDNTVMMVQELAEEVSRCSKLKKSNSDVPPDLEALIAATGVSWTTGTVGFTNGISGNVLAAGVRDFVATMPRSGTISKITSISIVDGVATAKTVKAQILKNTVNMSGSDPIYLNAATREIKTSFTWTTLDFVVGDELQLEILSSPTPDVEYFLVQAEYLISE